MCNVNFCILVLIRKGKLIKLMLELRECLCINLFFLIKLFKLCVFKMKNIKFVLYGNFFIDI